MVKLSGLVVDSVNKSPVHENITEFLCFMCHGIRIRFDSENGFSSHICQISHIGIRYQEVMDN